MAWYGRDVSDDEAPISGATILRFRIGSIPVRVEFPFFLIAALLGVTGREGVLLVAWICVLFVSILVHELGHAVVARWFGSQPKIVLHAFGGLTFPGQIRTARQDIAVSVAGSLTQILLLGLPAFLLLHGGSITSYNTYVIVHDVEWVSLGWAIINLLPLLPLDGGHVSLTLLQRSRRLDAERLARQISVGVALGLAIWMYHSVGLLGALWVLFFGVLNAVELARMSSATR